MADARAVAAGFQHRELAGDVGALIGERIVQGIADPGLGREVHDAPGRDLLHQHLEGAGVGHVDPGHVEARPSGQARARAPPSGARHSSC